MTTTNAAPVPFTEQVDRCRQAQEAWARLSVGERLRPVCTLRRLLVAECDRLCEAAARDLSKTAEETIGGDLLPLADACRFLEREARALLRPRRVPLWRRPLWLMDQRDTVCRRPRGIVGIIGTWNYPFLLNGVALLQALTAGNGVLWKPSEVTPASAALLAELVARAGFPEALVQVLPATREAGRELAEAPVDHIAFTGSSGTGRRLAVALAGRLVSSTLELSGCDALFVLDDADVGLAARAAWFGATVNRGQTCIAARRVFVPRTLYVAFVEQLKPLAAAGPPLPQALPAQVEQAVRLVGEAVAEGGRLLEGVALPEAEGDGRQCRPLVVLDARPEMALCREATFAPVMAVLPYDSLDDALRMDAVCSYALGSSIFTRSPARAAALAARLRAGMVAVNDVVMPTVHPGTPFGGRGESGWGVTQGPEGLLEMTVPQVVSVRGGSFRPHYDLAPGVPGPRHPDLARALLEATHGSGLRRRCRALIQVVKALIRGQ